MNGKIKIIDLHGILKDGTIKRVIQMNPCIYKYIK